jgi:hypothetical protein
VRCTATALRDDTRSCGAFSKKNAPLDTSEGWSAAAPIGPLFEGLTGLARMPGLVVATQYSSQFYDEQVAGSLRSAEEVLPLVWRLCKPRSVIDVGCGRGAWLAVAERFGAEVLTGLDGNWVTSDQLLSKTIRFVPTNLTGNFNSQDRYDLCMSLEVAEHLAEASARTFVRQLCGLSGLVLFGAAVSGQGGVCHVNEQPQSYWIRLFRDFGYECLDVIRPSTWSNKRVEWWYRQNTFLFHHPSYKFEPDAVLPCGPVEFADVIHPDHFVDKLATFRRLSEQPTLRWIAGRMVAFMKHNLGMRRS